MHFYQFSVSLLGLLNILYSSILKIIGNSTVFKQLYKVFFLAVVIVHKINILLIGEPTEELPELVEAGKFMNGSLVHLVKVYKMSSNKLPLNVSFILATISGSSWLAVCSYLKLNRLPTH